MACCASNKPLAKTGAKSVMLTLGSEGRLISESSNDGNQFHTDRLDAFNFSPIDVSGAGDSMLVGASLSLAAGSSIWEAGFIGSVMSAIQVSRIGNRPITLENLTGAVG